MRHSHLEQTGAVHLGRMEPARVESGVVISGVGWLGHEESAHRASVHVIRVRFRQRDGMTDPSRPLDGLESTTDIADEGEAVRDHGGGTGATNNMQFMCLTFDFSRGGLRFRDGRWTDQDTSPLTFYFAMPYSVDLDLSRVYQARATCILSLD